MARLAGGVRALAIVVALVLAGVATYAIFSYVQGIEQRAFADAELVEVFVAEGAIDAGISAEAASEAGLFERSTAPRVNVPEGAITSLDQIAGRITLDRVLAGEIIVADRFVDPSEAVSRAIEIPEGSEALSVQVGIPPGVAGFIRPGDRINLIATVTAPLPSELEQEIGDDGELVELEIDVPDENRSQYLMQNIQVLATGQRVTTEEGDDGVAEGSGSILLTVALEPEDAERMVFAINNADLYFTLLPELDEDEEYEPFETPGRTFDNLFEQ